MKWQVRNMDVDDGGTATVKYYDPNDTSLTLFDSKLCVQPSAAKKINEGANKTVCAWIECKKVKVFNEHWLSPDEDDFRIKFNPRENPNWIDRNQNVISGNKYKVLFTNIRDVWAVGESYGWG